MLPSLPTKSIFDPLDTPKLQKLGVKNLAGLVLIAPKKYENRFLAKEPKNGEIQTIEVVVEQTTRAPNTLRLKLFSPTFNQTLQGVIFNPKPYQKGQFPLGKTLFLQGKIEYNPPFLQIIQPKIISSVNTIEPLYDTPLPTISLKALIKKYITLHNLETLGYDPVVTQELYTLHHPTQTITTIEQFLPTLKFVEITSYLLNLRKNRRYMPVAPLILNDPSPFITTLPFSLTSDQIKAIDHLYRDLGQCVQAKRMIIGDVGCGKTVVILAAIFMVSPYKSAILAPTSILANQLYEEAKKYLPSDFKITLLTQKTKSKDTLAQLNDATLIIGTHALLHTPLPPLRLLAIDEQHRFGTAQRNALATLTDATLSPPHIIQFSATPIPRTQAMIQSSLIDVTLIKQIPFTKKIDSRIITHHDFGNLLAHIENERLKGHQTIIVYPLVEASESINYQSLEEAKDYWLNLYSDTMITHGKDKEKEEILQKFKNEGTLLLTTTVIEVGISLPRLTTIVIVGAERLGLATLHQLRGRVGRVGLDGTCFLFTKSKEFKRLEEFCVTSSGFDIAELDLRYRQSGDLVIGKEQSGKNFKFIDIAQDHDIVQKGKEWVEGIDFS